MEDIATIDLQQYIKEELFDPETGRQEIWLHNLPNTSFLFEIINKLREKHKDETFVITQDINITNENINKEINFSNCILKKNVNFLRCIFWKKVNFLTCIFNGIVKFEESKIEKGIFVKNSIFFERVLFLKSVLENSYNDFFNGVVNFDNITFKDSIICSETSFENISFDNVQFKKGKAGTSEFVLCYFFYVVFSNTIFEEFTNFQENNEVKNISFKNTIFFGKTEFGHNSFIEKTNFLNCTFNPLTNTLDEQVLFYGSTFKGKVDFKGCSFNIKTSFSYSDSSETCHFYNNVDFKGCIFSQESDFSKVIFEGDTNFSETFFGKEGDTSSYKISFNNTRFNKVARFHSCNFYSNTKFENTSFYTLVDFYLSVFHKEQQFLRTDFFNTAIFSNTTFKGETQFLYNKVESNSYINFESAKFEKGLDISRANFNCNLNFWNIFIQDDKIFEFTNYTDDFGEHKEEAVPSVYKQLRETYRIIKSNFYSQNNKIEGLKFYEKEMSVYLEEKREETNKKSPPKNKKTFIEKFREKFMEEPILSVGQLLILFFTILWTILKCPIFYIASAIFTSLIISGIIIKNKESLKYRNPIKQNYYMPIILLVIAIILLYFYIYNIHNIKNPFYIIVTYIMLFFSMLLFYFPLEKDKIILWLNKNSNEFDTNWVVGVNFSMLVGCLTYFTILLSINSNIVFDESPKGISTFLTSLVDVFNITKWDNLEIIGVKLKDLSYLLLFIGRIFIGYGYYQTIQAFRKFGKS